jgi:hypothetical protein
LPVFAAFRQTSGGTSLGLGAKSLAGLEPLGAAFCIRRRVQSHNQRRGGAEPGAQKRKLSHFCLPSRLSTRANAKRVSAYLQSEAGVSASVRLVIPAQAGIWNVGKACWMPAFAGMTVRSSARLDAAARFGGTRVAGDRHAASASQWNRHRI